MTHPDEVVFVAADKGAAYLALPELGRGAAAHPTELWLHLRDQGHIDRTAFDQLCDKTRKREQGRIPRRCQTTGP